MAIAHEPILRVLLVEDSVEDSELLIRALRDLHRPISTSRVASEAELREALSEFLPHLVLSDHSMPGFSGHEALRIVQETAPQLPFIFVSGTIGEEAAIEALQRGATDYVLKDNLRRLPTAIQNALRTASEREELDRTERALRASEERFRAIVESTEDWVWEMSLDGRLTYTNGSVKSLLGYSPASLAQQDVLELLLPEDATAFRDAFPGLIAQRRGWRNWLLRWRHRDGSTRWLESTARPLLDEDGNLVGYRGIDRDITLRIQQEEKIRQLARIHAVLSALGTAILRSRDTSSLLDLACRLAVEQGQFHAAIIGVPTADGKLAVITCSGDPAVVATLRKFSPAELDVPFENQWPSVRAFLERRPVIHSELEQAGLPEALYTELVRGGVAAQVALPVGNPPWAVLCLFAQETKDFDAEEMALLERMADEIDYARDFIAKSERLEFLAYKDPVTGLPNRSAFEAAFNAALKEGPQLAGAIALVRSDQLSDARGRSFADDLLVALGRRLQQHFGDGLFAHGGPHSFLVAQSGQCAMPQCVADIERRLHNSAAEPLVIDGEQIHFSLRCGLALAPDNGANFDAIERSALAALAEAGRRNVSVLDYSDELRHRAERRLMLERELRVALAERQFVLFLQPKFDTRSRRLSGAEALLRWRHPQHGLISPAEFVPLLEETGLIIEAGRWVMATALEILHRWRSTGLGDHRIAVNVSARELREQGYVDACRELMEQHHHEHGLDIEVTESLLIEDIRHNIHVLHCLRDLGCRIAIDDFGTGYSSLNYLSRLPADVLKIDQSFTRQIASSPDTLALVTNIIALAHSLDLKVVAEGVEEEEQDKLLRLLRCDELQGYLLGRPVPVEEFEKLYLQ
jgi:PAS domain S-box-containing protein